MGSSASKAARKYPARPPNSNPVAFQKGTSATRPQVQPGAPISRHPDTYKSEAIERDGADPQFLSNLSKLGQVQVNHNMRAIRPAASNSGLFDSRTQSETSSSQSTKNHLYAFRLSDLLDRRKSVQTEKELGDLAEEFGIDMEKLEKLTRFVNSPSVDSSTIQPAAGKTEEEGFIATAVWVMPKLKS